MGWFTRAPSAPKPDPIGDICRSLAEQYWEWTPTETTEGEAELRHTTGVAVSWEMQKSFTPIGDYLYPRVYMAQGGEVGILVECSSQDSKRLYAAIQANAGNRVSRPRHTFTDAAKLLAQAVLDGNEQAAYALADEVSEFARGAH